MDWLAEEVSEINYRKNIDLVYCILVFSYEKTEMRTSFADH